MDLDSYQVALEDVLTWLLMAEDSFQEQDDISEDVEDVKQQFATHEVGLTNYVKQYRKMQLYFHLLAPYPAPSCGRTVDAKAKDY